MGHCLSFNVGESDELCGTQGFERVSHVFVLLGTENSNFLYSIACSASVSSIGIR
jgi:hypothetical protein